MCNAKTERCRENCGIFVLVFTITIAFALSTEVCGNEFSATEAAETTSDIKSDLYGK